MILPCQQLDRRQSRQEGLSLLDKTLGYLPGNVTQTCEEDVDEEVSTTATLKEDTKRLRVSM